MSRSALAAGIRYLRDKLASQQLNEESDEQLLRAFTDRCEESAFAVLVRRHGPMVLHVCRRVLGHEQDAEDAFQATFLAFARKAAALRNKAALASFLHGIAYRTALKAKQSAARRRKHEGALGALTQPRSPADPAEELSRREVRTLLDEEIARLPEKYRIVFILSCLENLSREETARRLGLKEGTVASRLAEARKRLQQRLTRRGVELTVVLGTLSLAAPPASALSPVLIAITIETALAAARGELMMGAISIHVAELVKAATPAAILSKTKITTVVLLIASALAGAGAWTYRTSAIPQGAEQPAETPKQPTASKPQREKDAVVMVKGRVLLPNGKPAANAVIRRRPLNESTTAVKETILTTTAADGRFEVEHRDGTSLIASAPGFAPDWTGHEFKGGDLTLTLAEPARVRGRLLNLEGKPVAEARVKILGIKVPVRGNLNAVTDAFRLNPEWTFLAMPKTLSAPIPHSTAETKTDAEGRFELEGFGINRILEIRFEMEGIESAQAYIILSADFDPKSVQPRPAERALKGRNPQRPTVYGPQFTHTVRPCQVITGTIADEATGKPIAGIKIAGTAGTIRKFDNTAWHDAVEAMTDRDGRYRLNGLPKAKGRHLHVKAGDAPYLDRLIDVPDAAGLTPVRLDIKLRKAMVIEGRLRDKATGKPVMGKAHFLPLESAALKRFLPNNRAYGEQYSIRPGGTRASSDAEGRFKLRVLPFPGVILARADTRRDPTARYTSIRVAETDRKYLLKRSQNGKGKPVSRTTENKFLTQEFFNTYRLVSPVHWENGYALVHPAKKDETVKVVIHFDAGRTLHGKIVGPDGCPLAGVQAVGVQATGERDPTTFRTDSYTVYALDSSRTRTVYFRHKKKNLIGTATLRGDETEAPLVKMQPAAAVIGRTLDAAGKPIAGMEVHIQFSEAGPDELIRQKLHNGEYTLTTTGADGRFRLEGMFPGLEFDVYVGRPGHRSSSVSFGLVTLQAGEVRDLGDQREKAER